MVLLQMTKTGLHSKSSNNLKSASKPDTATFSIKNAQTMQKYFIPSWSPHLKYLPYINHSQSQSYLPTAIKNPTQSRFPAQEHTSQLGRKTPANTP